MKLRVFLLITASLTLGVSSVWSQCTPVTKAVSGGGTLPCTGGATVNVVLETAELDAFYVLYKDNVEVSGSTRHDNNNQNITWAVSVGGVYTIKAYMDGCSTTTRYDMSGSATVNTTTPTTISISSSDPTNNVCEQTGYTLTASGGSGYTWHASITMDYPTNQSTIQPDVSGTYYVTG